MAQHAILRFEKHKGNPARPLEAHHERQKEQYASNPNIDTSRSKYNFHIVKPEGRYYHFIQSRIEQAGCRTRKDSTRFVDTLITASPEFFKGKSPKEIQAFFQRAAAFLTHRVGRENIVSAVVHMDEKTPHLHLTFVPLTNTKDLSRFGREHVMMDYYLEFLFPEKRVRYIAVAENEDTEKGLSDFVPFKNLFNEWFAKDTSRKVKAAFKAKFATGQRIGAYAPIGYKKHPEIKNKLIIDEETRWIVEKIFDLAFHGRGAASITSILIAEKVPTPGFINFQRDGTFANIYAGAPEEKSYAWTIAQVKSIMKDETYIGHTIHYRETNISFKNKRRVRKPQSEWVRVENTQEPIISEQVFRQVQDQIANRRRKCKDGTTQIFSGLVKCADCGWSLSYGENRQNSKPYGHYHCSKYGQGTRQCSMHYIRYDVLYAYVLSRLQYWSGLVQHDEERLLKRLLNATDKGQAAARKKQTAELKKAEKRKAEVDTLFARMYEDWAAGRITEYNFSMLSGKYQSEQAELDEKIERLQSAIATESQNAADAEKWIALMKECVNPTELTAELLNTLIEKIVVHEAVKGEDGSREQEVEIFYRFIGKID